MWKILQQFYIAIISNKRAAKSLFHAWFSKKLKFSTHHQNVFFFSLRGSSKQQHLYFTVHNISIWCKWIKSSQHAEQKETFRVHCERADKKVVELQILSVFRRFLHTLWFFFWVGFVGRVWGLWCILILLGVLIFETFWRKFVEKSSLGIVNRCAAAH